MSAIQKHDQGAIIESVVIHGDLSKLNAFERTRYYSAVCDSIGLNALTKPFEYIRLNGREVLYVTRSATDQLRKIHGVSIRVTAREDVGGVHIVTACATDATGRVDEAVGAVPIEGLKGESLANAFMKAESKAKRRVTLSICGLGMLDESELDTVHEDTEQQRLVQEVRENHTAVSEVQARHKLESEKLAADFDAMIDRLASDEDVARWCEFNGPDFRELHDGPRQKLWRKMTKKFAECGVKADIAKAWINQAQRPTDDENDAGEE